MIPKKKDAYGLSIYVSHLVVVVVFVLDGRTDRRTDSRHSENAGNYSGRTVVGALGTGGGTLVAGVARDTHDCRFCRRRRGGD